MNGNKGILNGLKVIDFTIALAGAYTAWQFADLGAEVWKIERNGSGDQARQWDPFVNGHSTLFMAYNKNKQSIEINLSKPEGKQIIYHMVKDADLVLENFKAGSIDRLGLGYDKLSEINPRIVFLSLSGFGGSGPLMKLPCYDAIAAARGGFAASNGEPDGAPMKAGNANCDSLTGTYAFNAALMGLIEAKKSGKGCRIDIGMSDVAMQAVGETLIDYGKDPSSPVRFGNHDRFIAPYGIFRAADGFVSIIADSESRWQTLCKVMLPQLADDKRFSSNALRLQHLDALVTAIEDVTKTMSRSEIERILLAAGVPASEILPFIEEYDSAHAKAASLTQVIEQPGVGKMRFYNNPIRFDNKLCEIRYPAPLLGEHTEKILKETGYTDEQIRKLYDDGIVGSSMI